MLYDVLNSIGLVLNDLCFSTKMYLIGKVVCTYHKCVKIVITPVNEW